MNNTIKNLFIFASGAAIGSVVTWKLVKTKYEQFAQEQIDSVKEVFSRRDATNTEEDADYTPIERDVESYITAVKSNGYSNIEEVEDYDEEEKSDEPYVISPEEFGTADGYKEISLTYYADKVLAEDGDIIDDIEGTVGSDSLETFGDYEDDAVHVRNNRLKVDYEILKDMRTYSEAHERRSY